MTSGEDVEATSLTKGVGSASEANDKVSPPRRGPGLSDVSRHRGSGRSFASAEGGNGGSSGRREPGERETFPVENADCSESKSDGDGESGSGKEELDPDGQEVAGAGGFGLDVEPPLEWHSSWDAWQTYLTAYCERTLQILPVRETMSHAERNKRLQRTKKRRDTSQMIPEGFDPYVHLHTWLEKMKSSQRRQSTKTTHSSNELPFPIRRSVELVQKGASVDVGNMVRDHAQSVSTGDDNEATAREIASFAASDPENISTVAETSTGETGVISLVTAHMRRVFGRFSELLLVDCSQKTNRYNYQLLTFMAMNEFGEGSVVQQSLLEANGDWHMDRAIAHFKRSHPTRISGLRVIVVDKDLNEIRVLQAHFSEARILICHFHVIKYLKEMRARPDFGKISSEDASQIDAAVHRLVYARSDEDYEHNHESLKALCERIGNTGFFEYFEKNWNSSQDRWVMYRRADLPHFRNNTKNRLESFFGKLKDGVDSSMSMTMCVRAILAYDRRVENEYKYRPSRIGQFVNSNYDEEMKNVLRFTTHFVTQQIEPQYASALEKFNTYAFTRFPDDSNIVLVRGNSSVYTLRTDNWRCDCKFSLTMSLPCRHAIAFRKREKKSGPLIPWSSIDERWMSSAQPLKKVKQFDYENLKKKEGLDRGQFV